MRSKFFIFLYLLVHTIVLLKPPGTHAENPEWMYFHDIQFITALEAIDNYLYIGRVSETATEAMRLNLETLVLDTIDTMTATITSFKKDLDGTIWIGTSGHGLVEYNGKIINRYTYENSGLPEYFGQKYTVPIRSIEVDKLGNKWIGTIGLVKYDNEEWDVYHLIQKPLDPEDNFHNKILYDSLKDNLWISTIGKGIAIFANSEYSIYDTTNSGIGSMAIIDMSLDHSGSIWFATAYHSSAPNSGKLVKFDGTNWETFDMNDTPLATYRFFNLNIDKNENKWIGTRNGGLVKFDGQNWTIYNKSNSNIGGNKVHLSTIDMYGNIWMSIYSDGNDSEQIGLEVFREGGVLLPTNVEETIIVNREKAPRLYPNPARDIIRVTDLIKRERMFKISNLYGQTVLEGTFYHEIDISKLISGFYFLNVDGFNLKFIKL